MKNYVIKSFGHYFSNNYLNSDGDCIAEWSSLQKKAIRCVGKERAELIISSILAEEPYLEGFVKAVKLKPKKSTLLIKEVLEQSKLFGYLTPDLIEKIEQHLKGNS